jgi:hypothetical protein
MFGYCLALLLVFDFAFSSLTRGDEQKRGSRIADPVYDHGFAAKFEGHEAWGELRCADSASRTASIAACLSGRRRSLSRRLNNPVVRGRLAEPNPEPRGCVVRCVRARQFRDSGFDASRRPE